MIRYVAGLYCSGDKRFNLLIKKNKPGHWQHEKINLIGGHIEEYESDAEAMAREFKEETGEQTYPSSWKHCITLRGPTWVVYFFFMTGPTFIPIPCDEGEVAWHGDIPPSVIPNLHWIIPLLKDETVVFPIYITDSR